MSKTIQKKSNDCFDQIVCFLNFNNYSLAQMLKIKTMKYEKYLPVVLAALSVLVLGSLNPPQLQSKTKGGQRTGCPSYLWSAIIALLVGLLTMYCCSPKMKLM